MLAEDMRTQGFLVAAHDVRQGAVSEMRAHAAVHGVDLVGNYTSVATVSNVMISIVGANDALDVADAAASGMRPGTVCLDLNPAPSAVKRATARVINGKGGRYLEGAAARAESTERIDVSLIAAGPHAAKVVAMFRELGFVTRADCDRDDAFSSNIMSRSIPARGLDALVIGSFATARAHGIEEAVLRCLQQEFPEIDWARESDYFFQQAIASKDQVDTGAEWRKAANSILSVSKE